MISWGAAIGLMLVAFVAGYAFARTRNRAKVVWSKAVAPVETPEVRALIESGNKIEAIKLYRQMFGTDLKDSKDAVEALAQRTPRA